MKKLGYIFGGASMLAFPAVAAAQIADTGGGGGEFETLLINIVTFINGILIPTIIAVGFLVFVWGMFQYFIAGGANDEKKESGKSLMIYATLGFVLIIIFWGIINLLADSTGLADAYDATNTPTTVVPTPTAGP